MSSILKALKKLENENAARNHDPLKIDSEILRGDSSDRVSPIKILLLAVFLFVCGGSATYVYMNMKQGQEAPHTPAKTLRPPVPVPLDPLPSSSSAPVKIPVERIEPETIVASIPESDTKQNPRISRKTEVTYVPTRPLLSAPPKTHSNKTQHPQRGVEKKQQQTPIADKKAVSNSHSAATALPPPTLKVNGIAFQNGSDSVAVINGVPVSEGSSIEGAKVVEIQRDRILFSYGGEKFNVQLGKSNR